MSLLWTFTLKYICSTDLCSLIDGKMSRCHGEVAFMCAPKKRARFARACASAPFACLPTFQPTTRTQAWHCSAGNPSSGLRARPHPQCATVSRVHARLSCVTSARGHQLRRGTREKAPFRTSDNRRPSRARAAGNFNLSSLAQKRFPPRLASRAASREGKLCLVGDCLSWQGSKSYALAHLIVHSVQYTAIH